MTKFKANLNNRIAAYSGLSAAFLVTSADIAKAQVNYIDPPNVKQCDRKGDVASYYIPHFIELDMRNGAMDNGFDSSTCDQPSGPIIRFELLAQFGSTSGVFGPTIFTDFYAGVCSASYGAVQILPVPPAMNTDSSIARLSQGYMISSGLHFGDYADFLVDFNSLPGTQYDSEKEWSPSPAVGFLGVKFTNSGNTHYGWVRLKLTFDRVNTTEATNEGICLEVMDLAYNSTPNAPIKAGEGILTATIARVDASITDPCDCLDPMNVRSGDAISLFHDFAEITNGGVGETWRLTSVNSGEVLDVNGNPIPLMTAMTENSGTFRLDLFHSPNVGFNATFTRDSDGATLTTGGTCDGAICSSPENIPTVSQWGLLILGLLLLTFGTVSLKRKKIVPVGLKNSGSNEIDTEFHKPLFFKSLYFKALIYTSSVLSVIGLFTASIASLGFMPYVGMFILSPVLAYFIHLVYAFINNRIN